MLARWPRLGTPQSMRNACIASSMEVAYAKAFSPAELALVYPACCMRWSAVDPSDPVCDWNWFVAMSWLWVWADAARSGFQASGGWAGVFAIACWVAFRLTL